MTAVPTLHPSPAPPPLARLAASPALRALHVARTVWRARRDLLHMFHPEAAGLPWLVSDLGATRLITVNDAGLARHVLSDAAGRYRKGPLYAALLGDVLGMDSSLLLEGEASRARRRLLAPAFNARAMARLEGLAVRRIAAALEDWVRRGEIDLGVETARLTMAIALEAFFSTDLGARTEEAARLLDRILVRASEPSLADLLALPGWVPRRSRADLRADVARIDALLAPLIAARRGRPAPESPDLLDALVHARDAETGAALSDRAVRDEVMTLLMAGHETTALAMAWGLDRLAREPAWLARLRAEPGLAAWTFEEILRLYPPAYALAREAAEADLWGDLAIRPGDRLQIPIFMLHRNPRYWREPDRFDPTRFAQPPEPGAFLPFGAGPRLCIGLALARLEGRALLRAASARCDIRPVGAPPRAVGRVTLRPAAPIRLSISTRRQDSR